MLEVEAKFRDADFTALEDKLVRWHAHAEPPREDEDHYFNAPDRDFAATDEAFRIRRIGSANFVTYKGPKRDKETKTRTEIETPLAEGDKPANDFMEILKHLGYRPTAVVRKTRRVYRLNRGGFALEVCLDEVEGLGRFAELEIQANESQFDAAKKVLLEAAATLGLTETERRSYLEMVLTAQGKK
jgi:adenylate cyclase class 2